MENSNQTSVVEFIFLAFSKKSTKYPALFFAIFLLLYFVIIWGNILMILVIRVDIRLHTPMYFFVLNLSCLDIGYCTTIVPQLLNNLVSSRSSILYLNCAIQMYFANMFGVLQILIMTMMGYDRYVAISNPLRYKTIMSWTVCTLIIGLAWILCILLQLVMVLSVFSLPYCCKANVDHFYCDVGQILILTSANEQRFDEVGFITIFLGILFTAIPFFFIFISYIYIVSAVLKICNTQGQRKAFSTCSSHLTLVIAEYVCIGFIYYRPREAYVLDKDKVFVLIFTFITPILNPVIFTLRNNAIKKGFIKLISVKLC